MAIPKCPMWLAYRMSGFGGTVVPELVQWVEVTGLYAALSGWWAKCEGGWLNRSHEVKAGELFATEAECRYRCDWLNRKY